LIIYDYSYEYQIKPFKVVTDPIEMKEIIHEIKSAEKTGRNPIRVLLTVNIEEIVVHYPSDLPDDVVDTLETELRNLHTKMSLFIADTIITLDLVVQENDVPSDEKSYLILIIDLLNFNGIDYRSSELRVRRGLTRTFFQGFISSPIVKISDMYNVYNSIHDMDLIDKHPQGVTKHELFGYQTPTHGNWVNILIRDETSNYNDKMNNEWRLINVESIPSEIRGLF
jgi:hypothetical protein